MQRIIPPPLQIFRTLREERELFQKLLRFGLPIALQNLVSTSLNMVDTLMIGRLGESSIAAVALSNQIFFLLMLFLFGISSGTAVFTAQFWGKGDRAGVHRALGIALALGLLGSGAFTLAMQLIPERVLGLFTRDQAVIRAAVPYLRITSASYMFTAMTFIFQGVMRSLGMMRLPLFLSMGALSLNAFFNYALIFGRFGLPRLGIVGAAAATSGARVLEMGALIALVYLSRSPAAASFKQLSDQNLPFLKQYAWKVFPVILNEIGWSLGITMFTLIYARMGTSVLAAFNITDTFGRLAYVLFIGSSHAAAIILGNKIGAGRAAEADRGARTILAAVPFGTALFSLMIFSAAPFIPGFFNISAEAARMIPQFFRVFSLILLVKTSNLHIIVGILRSGGDTHYCMAIELLPLWLVSIPLVALAGLVLHWPPAAVYGAAVSEELIKYVMGTRRIRSGRWIHDLTG